MPSPHHDNATHVFARVKQFLARPAVLVILGTILVLSKILTFGVLTYGDIPSFSVHQSKINFLYAWGPQQLGTNVRQGFNAVRDQAILALSPNDYSYYFLKYVLPLLLLPLMYLWIIKKLGITSKFVLVIAALSPLFTPIVFGDFLTGQTFWVYLTVPWVYYLAIKIFCYKEFKLHYYVLLALFLFLSLGALPPIIVPLLASLCIMAGIAFLLDASVSVRESLPRYVGVAAIVGILFFALSAPYLLVASSGQAAYTPSSLLGDYYHNYSGTDLLNTLRLAGNNGGGQHTLQYNSPTYLNLVGYLLVALVVFGSMWFGLKDKAVQYRSMIISLLTVMIALLGFMNIMAVNPVVGAKVFQSQWIVSTIRNPSKLYVLILPIFTILLAFSLQNYMQRYGRTPKWQVVVGALSVLLIVSYGWPALRGDLGLLYHRKQGIAAYKLDQVDQKIIRQVPQSDRSLLLPANHRDELNYQNVNPGFNILQLEGGQPDTTKYMQQMRAAFNNQDSYFFNYANAAGINNLFLKKSEAAYQDSLFDLFPVGLPPSQAAEFLKSNSKPKTESNDYWQYKNQTASGLVYSPKSIIAIKGVSDLVSKAPFLAGQTAVVDQGSIGMNVPGLANYNTYTRLPSDKAITTGKAQLHDPTLVLADIYARQSEAGRSIVIDTINPVTNAVEASIERPVTANASVLTLGDDHYQFTAQKRRITLRAEEYDMATGSLQPVDLSGINPTFEGPPTPLTDGTPDQPGKAALYSSSSSDRVEGRQSLLIGSKNHTGFIEKELPITDPTKNYVLSFSYKNVRGALPSFAIEQGDMSLLDSEGKLGPSSGWQTHEAYFTMNDTVSKAGKVKFYIYTGNSTGQISENFIDNIQLSVVTDDSKQTNLSIPQYHSDYDIASYTGQQSDRDSGENLLSNGSFEDEKGWSKAGDATVGAGGKAHVQAERSRDAAEGKWSLKLSSSNHTAYVSRPVGRYEPNAVYHLSLKYKHLAGRNPTIAVWQDGVNISSPSQELKGRSGTWNTYDSYFVPEEGASNLTMYLYSPSAGEKTVNLYDDIQLEPTSLVSTYFEKINDAAMQPTSIVGSFKRINPTAINVEAKPGTGLVVFNESFQKGWKAYIVKDSISTNRAAASAIIKPPGELITGHIEVNGFANGWVIDAKKYKAAAGTSNYHIALLYTPQRAMYKGFIVSGLTMIAVTAYLANYAWRNRFEHIWRQRV
jgi:hypothetical protein